MNTRIQLTLYVPPPVSEQLEAVRRLLDPIQASLIAAHVTLCREDELASAETSVFWSRLAAARAGPVTLSFGHPEPFNEHGILLPCVAGEEEFQALRRLVLGSDEVRRQAPHITLAHPRNPKATDNSLSNAGRFQIEATISFTSVCLIEQEGSSPWRVLEQYALAGKSAATPNHSIERTALSQLRCLKSAAHVKRYCDTMSLLDRGVVPPLFEEEPPVPPGEPKGLNKERP